MEEWVHTSIHIHVHVVLIGLLDSACVAESDRDDLALATYHLTEVELLTGEFHAWPCHFG